MLIDDFDSDDKLEIIIEVVIAHELSNSKGGSRSQCGSVLGPMFIKCNSLQGHQRFFLEYFADSLVYPPNLFWKKF